MQEKIPSSPDSKAWANLVMGELLIPDALPCILPSLAGPTENRSSR